MKQKILLFVALATAIIAFFSCDQSHYLDYNGLQPGNKLPQFEAKTIEGVTVNSTKLEIEAAGKPYALLVFKTDCTECELLLTQIARLYEEQQIDIPMYGVSLGSAPETESFLEKTGLHSLKETLLANAKTVYRLAGDTTPLLAIFNDQGSVRQCIRRERHSDTDLASIINGQ